MRWLPLPYSFRGVGGAGATIEVPAGEVGFGGFVPIINSIINRGSYVND